MNDTPANLTIGALAQAAQVNVETIRYYQRQGLLPEPKKPYGGIRRYSELEIMRVRFIKSAQRLGFSLNEIGELLQLDGDLDCPKAQELAERKLGEIREKLSLLSRMEAALAEMVNACHAQRRNQTCPLISSLYGGQPPAAHSRDDILSQEGIIAARHS